MRGAPQVGFSVTMRKMSSSSSTLMHFLPARVRCRESHCQYNLNPALCQRTTVSGWTKISACFHAGQKRRKSTQNNLSETATRGRGCFCFQVVICCLRARFSKSRSRREPENRVTRISKRLSRRTIQPGLHTRQSKRGTQCKRLIQQKIAILASHSSGAYVRTAPEKAVPPW